MHSAESRFREASQLNERAQDSSGSLFLGGFIFSSLCTSAGITSVGPGFSVLRMGIDLLHVGSDGLVLVLRGGSGSWENLSGDLVGGIGRGDLLGGSVVDQTLLGLALLSWEEDKLGFVRVESLNVELELLLASGGSSVIDRDADSSGEFLAEASALKLGEGEAASISDLACVATSA